MVTPKKTAAKAAQTVAAADPAVTTGAQPGTQIAPPAAETMQSEQDGAGAADSSIPAAIDPAAPTYTETVPVAALAPADPAAAAIARQLVEGDPNPDLVEAVRQFLASSAFTPPVAVDPAVRLGFPVLMHLDLDLDKFEPGELAFVTEDEFEALQKAKVFSDRLEWEDGVWPEGTSDGGEMPA